MSQQRTTFLGMDRNDYPGDANMQVLRKTFVFSGYWLNNPPGAERNTWAGRRADLQTMGFGFLLLFNGREYLTLSPLATLLAWVRGMQLWHCRLPHRRDSRSEQSFFSTRSREAVCFPSSAPIFMPGSTAY